MWTTALGSRTSHKTHHTQVNCWLYSFPHQGQCVGKISRKNAKNIHYRPHRPAYHNRPPPSPSPYTQTCPSPLPPSPFTAARRKNIKSKKVVPETLVPFFKGYISIFVRHSLFSLCDSPPPHSSPLQLRSLAPCPHSAPPFPMAGGARLSYNERPGHVPGSDEGAAHGGQASAAGEEDLEKDDCSHHQGEGKAAPPPRKRFLALWLT